MSKDDPKPARVTALSKEEHRQLLTHHMSKLRAKRAEVEELKAPLKEAQEEFTALVNEAKADLGKGYTRKYMMSLLEDSTSRLRNLLEEENRRAQDREALGLPVFGVQADLFGEGVAAMPDEARDEVHYEAEGYMRGRAGLLEVIPDGTPPRFHQAVQRGYEKGQQATQEDFVAAQELRQKRATPVVAETADLAADEPDEQEVLDDKIRKLKRSGFMNTGADVEQPAAA